MKILVSSINFYPDHSGIALYSTDLPVFFAEKGQQVSMVTGFSYYPRWVKRKEDKGVLFRTEEYRGVKVYRGYLYVPRKLTTLKRLLHDLSFIVSALCNFFRAGRHDVIVVLTPPLLLGLVGLLLKRLWRAKLVVHIQDFQLEAALSLGMLKENILIRLLAKLDSYIYRKCDLVVPITQGMKEVVVAKGVDEKKTFVVYNWIDINEAAQKGQKGIFISSYPKLLDKFIIAYAGNLGVKQGVDIILYLAEKTRHNTDIHYFIIGEGADKERLMNIASHKKISNVTFHPFLNQEQYYNMLRDIHVSAITQKSKTGNVFFPSKILGILAQSKPILLSADLDSELAKFISENGCGLAAAAGDIESLARHVKYLSRPGAELSKIGKQCFSVVQQFEREKILSAYLLKIIDLSGN